MAQGKKIQIILEIIHPFIHKYKCEKNCCNFLSGWVAVHASVSSILVLYYWGRTFGFDVQVSSLTSSVKRNMSEEGTFFVCYLVLCLSSNKNWWTMNERQGKLSTVHHINQNGKYKVLNALFKFFLVFCLRTWNVNFYINPDPTC